MFISKFLKKIIYLLHDERKKIPFLILLFLILSSVEVVGLSLIAPYISLVMDLNIAGGFIDQIIDYLNLSKEKEPLLISVGLGLLAIFLMKTILYILVNAIIIYYSQKQRVRLALFLMKSYQSLSYVDLLHRNTSELIYNIQSLTSQFANTLILLLRTVSDGIVGLIIFAFLAWNNLPVLLVLITLFGILLITYDTVFKFRIRQYGEDGNIASDLLIKGITEGMSGFKEIRVLGKESYFYNMVSKGVKEHATNNIKHQIVSSIPRSLIELLMVVFIVTLVIFTITMGGSLQELIPTLGLFSIAGLRILPSISTASNALIQLRYSDNSVSRLYNDIQGFQHVADPEINKIHTESFHCLEADRITFSYPESIERSLNNVTFKINSGDSIGIIGASGSGKTTLIDIILGLLTPDSGKILYNKRPLTIENVNSWMSHIAYIPQNIFLLDDTLRKNITLESQSEVHDKKIVAAMKRAQIYELIDKLPKGLDTVLGEKGMRISGGQRQRIALARAFYHDRSIIVMDEATSALDDETEQEVVREIKNLKGKVTFIIIAHRLSTIKHCDVVFEMKNGAIVDLNSNKSF